MPVACETKLISMSKNETKIGGKTLLWFVVAGCFLCLLIISLNGFDKNRKYRQFINLNDRLLSSEYPPQLADLLEHFSFEDSAEIEQVRNIISVLTDEIVEIQGSILYLKDSIGYTEIKSYSGSPNSKLYTKNILLPSDIRHAAEYLDSTTDVDLKVLYKMLSAEKKYTRILLKTGRGYLYSWTYRR